MSKNSGEWSRETIWIKIKKDLELDIISGIYKSADKMPSVADLAELNNVAGKTAQRVLESMYNDKTLTKKRGVGFFVMPYSVPKLKTKHLQALRSKLQEVTEEAKLLNIDKSEFLQMLTDVVDKLY